MEQRQAVPSDTEGEKPVREQLKKASIDQVMPSHEHKSQAAETETEAAPHRENGDSVPQITDNHDRGRVQRKRSFDDIDAETKVQDEKEQEKEVSRLGGHRRKRSRDSLTEDKPQARSRTSGEETRPDEDAEVKDGRIGEERAQARPVTPELSSTVHEATAEELASPKTKKSRLDDARLQAASDVPKLDEPALQTNGRSGAASDEVCV